MMTDNVINSPESDFPPAQARVKPGLLSRLASLFRFLIAVILSLTPFTAILVMGWLMRLMHREQETELRRLRQFAKKRERIALPRWVRAEGLAPSSKMSRWFGSLKENLQLGLSSLTTLALGTLPFTLLWLFSWWGGWENSFNKGYEQAWVGPITGLLGVAISLPLLARLPMALAHQAREQRMSAFFAWREVSSLIHAAGWRYIFLSLLIVLSALPLFLAKGAPVFAEQWQPGLFDRNAEEIKAFARSYQFWSSVYLIAVLVLVRRSAARLHAFASIQLEDQQSQGRASAFLGRSIRTVLLWLICFGLVMQIYVGQFLNHQWMFWLNHPLIVIPWITPPGLTL